VRNNPLRGGAGYRRRDALALAGLAAAGLATAGCGDTQAPAPRPSAAPGTAGFWARQRRHGHVNFANWPFYIDASHATLHEFTAATGITVAYTEIIQENEEWFNKISPILRKGEDIGYDVMVITDGFQFSELVALDELTPLDQRRMTNFYAHAAPAFKNRSFDPGNTYSMPWASGSTGIAWNPKFIKTPVTSMNDLWNPAYKGELRFVIPEEGGTIWTDNMVIPRQAQNPVDAMMLMDWYYQPKIAAQLIEAINFIPPVPAARAIVAADAGQATGVERDLLHQVATSDLVWLTRREFGRLHNYADVSGKQQEQYMSIFQPVVTG